jgi:hypothetical protein
MAFFYAYCIEKSLLQGAMTAASYYNMHHCCK